MKRVLVLERDAAKRQQLRTVLEDHGFEVFEAAAADGARQARGNRVRTVVAGTLYCSPTATSLPSPTPCRWL